MKKAFIIKLLIVIVVIIAIFSGIAYFKWNKPHLGIEDADAKKVTAIELYSAFTKDSANAIKNFTAKDLVLEVSGEVGSVSKNQQNKQLIMLKTSGDGVINCEFEGITGDLKTGTKIVIKGICTGIGQGDAEMGLAGDVYLTRCYIKK